MTNTAVPVVSRSIVALSKRHIPRYWKLFQFALNVSFHIFFYDIFLNIQATFLDQSPEFPCQLYTVYRYEVSDFNHDRLLTDPTNQTNLTQTTN